MSNREIVKTEGDYRAVIIREEYADAPDGDFQAAVLRTVHGSYRTDVDAKTSAAADFQQAAERFLGDFGHYHGLAVFQRYLAIFHGTRDFREFSCSYSPDSAVYVAFDSAAMRKEWGCAEDATDGAGGTASEWQAYIDGDVYGVAIERRVRVTTQREDYSTGTALVATEFDAWDEISDSAVWGHYGETWAAEAAVNALTDYIKEG